MTGWALRFLGTSLAALGPLRTEPELEVLVLPEEWWLRGERVAEPLRVLLAALPAWERFDWHPPDRLIPPGCRVPTRLLPTGRWQAPAAALPLTLPESRPAGFLPERVPLRCVPETHERPANVLRLPWSRWRDYALEAPQIRLDRLRFATFPPNDVILWGTPLPPLPGRFYVEQGGVAVPCGMRWDPPLATEVLAELWRLQSGDLALLHPEGKVELAAWDDFLQASRPAVRAVEEALA